MKLTLYTTREELLNHLNMSEDECWDYMSLDDWDYALVYDGTPSEEDWYTIERCLNGVNNNEVVQLPNHVVGMAYHA